MNQAGTIIVSIIIFILGICFVICLHELGHLSMAKLFKVYCHEYSIGFGPKILSINPKNKETGKPLWETTVNIRCIPLGGYVAMADENDDQLLAEEGLPPVPKERTFSGVNRGKQAIIMVAGIVMNVLLSYFLSFFANAFFPQQDIYTNRITVQENSLASNQLTLATGDRILSLTLTYPEDVRVYNGEGNDITDQINTFAQEIQDSINNSKTRTRTAITTFFDVSNSFLTQVYTIENNAITYQPEIDLGNGSTSYLYLVPAQNSGDLTVTLSSVGADAEKTLDGNYANTRTTDLVLSPKLIDTQRNMYGYYESLSDLGITPFFSYSPRPYNRNSFITGEGDKTITGASFARALGQGFFDQGNGIAATFQALGGLFTPSGWENVGGIVSIFRTTEQAVSIGPFYVFYLWGLISINVAVLNLIPVPGLDGWQLLICGVESITRKKVNKKFKTWAALVGIGTMVILGIALLIVDIIRWVG